MIEILNKYTCYNPNMLFDKPNMFFLFILIGIHLIWYFLFRKNIDTTINFSNLSLLSSKKSWKEKLINLPYILRIIAISLIILSLSQPYINEEIPVQENKEELEEKNNEQDTIDVIDIVIAMDISGSMLATDIKPNRLTSSKKIGIDFIKKRKNDRIGLVVFSGESFTQCPLTTDHNTLINLFNDIEYGMVNDGTAIGDGLGNSINRLIDSDAKSKIIILLTDGENTSGKISPLTAADIAASDSINIKVYTICFGQKSGEIWAKGKHFNGEKLSGYITSFFDESTLKQIAFITGGEYFRATDTESLKEIYQKINDLETTKVPDKEIEEEIQEKKYKKIWKFYKCTQIALILLIISFLLKISYFRKIN